MLVLSFWCSPAGAQSADKGAVRPPTRFTDILVYGGVVGLVIIGLSVAATALTIEHLVTIRRPALMPMGLAEEVHQLIAGGRFTQAEQQCKLQPSFLGYVLVAGLAEVEMGYPAVEKAMEDASQEQAARLFRKIEYLSVIGNLAPMLGLLGTVWGMIGAFMQFEQTPNPQVAELAPGIYKALITTVEGLVVASPVLALFAIFRNRVDQLVAEATLLAEHVFVGFKRQTAGRRTTDTSAVAARQPE
jgi:biopolymer transport protein ExbB